MIVASIKLCESLFNVHDVSRNSGRQKNTALAHIMYCVKEYEETRY